MNSKRMRSSLRRSRGYAPLLIALAMILSFLSVQCGGERQGFQGSSNMLPQPRGTGRVGVHFSPKIAPDYTVSRVEVVFSPDGITGNLVYNSTSQIFSGIFTLEEGWHTVTASVYAIPNTTPRGVTPQDVLVGQGSATFEVIASATVGVYLAVSDTSGTLPGVDAGPIILSVVASNLSPRRGESVTFTVSAKDPNGDPLSYQWSEDCTSGVFSDPTSFTTTWSSSATGTCTISILVSANALMDFYSFSLNVLPALGDAQITVDYVPNPAVTLMELDTPSGACVVTHSSTNATCTYSVAPGTAHYLYVEVNWGLTPPVSAAAITVSDTCGGSFVPAGSCDGSSSFCEGTWTAPAAADACLITATATHYNLSDSLSLGIGVK